MKRLLCLLLTAALLAGLIPAIAETADTQAVPLPSVGDVVEGFEVKEIRDFPLVGGTAVLFEHQKTGAGLTYIANEDTNRVYTLAFLTHPTDRTGIPHVFEHSVLDGSEKWPSKALFFNLSFQTYNTFMNASTYPTMTIYPVASLSEAQLLRYTEYYTDSCLHPMVLTDESIFLEEAWRYRMASMEDDLTIEGTVYSEMLGATTLASAASLNAKKVSFPGSVAGFEHGGDPECIPDMTWENLRNYHSLYYHPSNSMAYLYGQFQDYTAFLKVLDEAYSGYEREEFRFEDSGYQPLTESAVESIAFPTESGSDPNNQSTVYYTFLCPGLRETEDTELVLNTLTDLLISNASPLMQALHKAIPSGSFATYILTETPDDAIVFSASNVNPEDAELFRSTVDSVLKDLAENGFSQDMVDSVMSTMSLNIKLTTESSSIGTDLLPSIAYSYSSSGNPFSYMDYVDALMEMDHWNQEGLYQKAIQDWLINDSVVSTLVTTYPQPGLKEEKDAALAAALAEKKAGMSEEELQAIIDFTNREEPEEDTSEMVASLQAVTVESLPEEIRTYELRDVTGEDGVRRMDAVAGVEGVGKVAMFLDAKGLPQDALHYFKLFTDLIGKLDTGKHTVEELDVLSSRYLYSREIRPSLMKSDTEEFMPWLRLGWTALDADLAAGYDLMAELLYETSFDDIAKLTEKVSAVKAGIRSSINSNAAVMSIYTAFGRTLPIDRYYCYLNYTPYYTFLEQVEADLAENPQTVVDQLKEIQTYFHNRTNAVATFAGNEGSIALNRPLADAFLDRLESRPLTHVQYDLPYADARQAIIVDSGVQFNGLVSDYASLGLENPDASLSAVMSLINDRFLLPMLRDQYGVYTPMAGAFVQDGIYMLTYRDPNIKETFDVYDSLADLIDGMELDQDTVDGYILSTYSALATSAGELSGAVESIVNTLNGDPLDITLQYMREVKSLTPEKVKACADLFRKLSEVGTRITSGSAAAINANSEMFDSILNPFNAKDTSEVTLEDVAEGSEHYESVRFVFENSIMAPLSDTQFGVAEPASTGDLMGGLYVLLGGSPNAPEEARDWLAGYGLVAADLDIASPLNEQFAVDLLAGAFGQKIIDTDTPDLVMTRGDVADLLQMLSGALTQQ